VTKITIIVGTRPEIIKMAPIIRALKEEDFTFVHTGQHYDYEMSRQFIEELELPNPKFGLELKERSPPSQVGEMMLKLEPVLKEEKPKLVLVQGDTNSTLASALTALKLKIPVGHVEAGLRSFDWRMPEEHNRIIVDHISELLFAPTKLAESNLVKERVHGEVHVTGNTVVDAVLQHMPMAEKRSKIMESVEFDEYALVTVHRAENVDDPVVLRNFVKAFLESPIPIVFPAHPRTIKRLKQFKFYDKLKYARHVQLIPPVGYFDMLVLMKNCVVIMTDSGGLQEEATVPCIRKPVLVLRLSTERPEAVESGFAKVVGVKTEAILRSLKEVLEEKLELPRVSPFGDGRSGERIARISLNFTLRNDDC